MDQRGQRHDRLDHDRDVVLPRLGILEKDEARIEAATGKLERQLNLIEDSLRKSTCLAGDRLMLGDLFLAPKVFWLDETPEGQATPPKRPALRRWYQAIAARPSFQATAPPLPGQAAA